MDRVLGAGIVGLGGAAVNMLPAFARNPRFRLAGAADIDRAILDRFERDYPGTVTYADVAALCDDPRIDMVYIGTPNRLHCEHAMAALTRGKHVLIEKPMAVTLEEADGMIAAAERNGVLLGVNVKHSFEPRIQKLREFARTGELGRLRAIHNWRFADWLYRPRTASELTPAWGNGIVWRQGPHQFDIVRTIGGGTLRSVRANVGVWDPARRVAGSFTAFLEFEDGACATVVCSGYDHFDSRALVRGFDGKSPLAEPDRHARARRKLAAQADSAAWEAAAAAAERYGGGRRATAPSDTEWRPNGWVLGGPLIACFEKADVRLSPRGLVVDGDDRQWEIAFAPDRDGRDGRLDSFHAAVVEGAPLPADGRWGKATQEVLVAVEQSSETRADVTLAHQVPSVLGY